jgi:hypothetical protein
MQEMPSKMLLTERQQEGWNWQDDEEEEVSSYWMTFRK